MKKYSLEDFQFPIFTRQNFESDKAWTTFQAFRDTPTSEKRSLKNVALKCGISYETAQNYSSCFLWTLRAKSFDRHLDSEITDELRRGVISMKQRHLEISGMMLDLVQKKLQTMKPKDLTARDTKDWLATASKIEVSSRLDVKDSADLVMTKDELDAEIKSQMTQEARTYYHEMRAKMPEIPISQLLSIIKDEFDVTSEELGIKLDDVLDSQIIE